MYKISLPLRVRKSKNKWFSLNINQYRNTHFHALNATKRNFNKQLKSSMVGIPYLGKCSLVYTLYPPNKRLCDVANICSIVDKYFCDSLVHFNKLKDDNYYYVPEVKYTFGQIDPSNPRVDVEIFPLEEINIMKVILEASDIRQALTEYAANNLPFSSDDSLDIILDDDMTVEISVGGSVDKPEPKSSTTKRKGRPKKKTQESKQDSTEEKDTSLNEDTTGAFDESTSTSSSEPEDKEQAEEPKSLFAGFAKTSNG